MRPGLRTPRTSTISLTSWPVSRPYARSIGDVFAAIMALGLEHGLGIANCDHHPALRSLAAQRGIRVVEIA